MRREIENAISERRNIIPLFFDGFYFGAPSILEKLTGKLSRLKRYNGLEVSSGYFDEAMERLRDRYLNVTLDAVLHPVSEEVQRVVKEQQVAANRALLNEDEHKKQTQNEREEQEKKEPDERARVVAEQKAKEGKVGLERQSVKRPERSPIRGAKLIGNKRNQTTANQNFMPYVISALVIFVLVWLISKNPESEQPIPTPPAQVVPTITSVPPNEEIPEELNVGSTIVSPKDGMTLLYVPAGEFKMGSDADEALAECKKFNPDCQKDWFIDQEPSHVVNLDAYWIDQTEVTNAIYTMCVKDGACYPPVLKI